MKLLRHVVLVGFTDETTKKQLEEIEANFIELPQKISEIAAFEWGHDSSHEGRQKEHTHCYFMSFKTEADRDAYLIHPVHVEFLNYVTDKIKTLTVVDYWVED